MLEESNIFLLLVFGYLNEDGRFLLELKMVNFRI